MKAFRRRLHVSFWVGFFRIRHFVRRQNPLVLLFVHMYIAVRGIYYRKKLGLTGYGNIYYFKVRPTELIVRSPKDKSLLSLTKVDTFAAGSTRQEFFADVTFQALRQVIERGVSWYKLPFYVAAATENRRKNNARTRAHLVLAFCRVRELRALEVSLRAGGRITGNSDRGVLPGVDEIGVDIVKDGFRLNRGGSHRLALAILLDCDLIEVVLCRIDKELNIKDLKEYLNAKLISKEN